MKNPPTRHYKAHSSQIRITDYSRGDCNLTIYARSPKGNLINLEIQVCEWGLKHALNDIAEVFREMKKNRERLTRENRRAFEQESL